ncbi:hypothetical protein JTB14_004957 [Gonioctena quinquepunctata]|nr:hypothetical protein JTB14_004957 [Gonioctena quinquepunctata]
MAGRGQWFTPIAVQKNKNQIYQKLEDTCWKAQPLNLTKEINYFNNDSQHTSLPQYDIYFSYTHTLPLWDIRKIRDNRSYLPDIRENIFEQEKHKPVPALSSMIYGRPCRVPYDISESTHRRKNATSDFKRRRGIKI